MCIHLSYTAVKHGHCTWMISKGWLHSRCGSTDVWAVFHGQRRGQINMSLKVGCRTHMGAYSVKAMTTEMPSLHLLYDISAPNILHLCTNLHACVIYCVWGANKYVSIVIIKKKILI